VDGGAGGPEATLEEGNITGPHLLDIMGIAAIAIGRLIFIEPLRALTYICGDQSCCDVIRVEFLAGICGNMFQPYLDKFGLHDPGESISKRQNIGVQDISGTATLMTGIIKRDIEGGG